MRDLFSKTTHPRVWKRPKPCVTCNGPWGVQADRVQHLLGPSLLLSSTAVTGAEFRDTPSFSVGSPLLTSKCYLRWAQFLNYPICWSHSILLNRLFIQKYADGFMANFIEHYGPGTVLDILQIITNVIRPATLWGKCFYYLLFRYKTKSG